MKGKTLSEEKRWWKGRSYLLYPEDLDHCWTEMEHFPHANAPWLPVHMNTLLVRIYSYSTQSESSTREIGFQS